jgi:type III restriction enzyme
MEDELREAVKKIFSTDNIFVKPTIQIVDEYIQRGGDNNVVLQEGGYRSAESNLGIIPYGEFLKKMNKRTALPIPLLHTSIVAARRSKETPKDLFNIVTLDKIVNAFEKQFTEMFAQKYSYSPLDYTARTSIFTCDGNFVYELEQGLVGIKIANDIPDREGKIAKYLYDKFVYDSEIEHSILKVTPPERVVVYGKLPKKSIKVPTYTGGTTSPDFVYAVRKKESNNIELHLIVETKSEDLRNSEKIAIEAQQKAFKLIDKNIEWRIETDVATFERHLKELAEN